MEVSLGFLDSTENILVRKFSLDKEFLGEETIRLNDLSARNLDGLFLSSEEMNEDVLEKLKEELNFLPISKAKNLSLSFSDFKNLNPLMALSKLIELNSSWVLRNNLHLIENIFETVKNLKNIIHQERELFFKDFYLLLKNNLGAIDMVLYFNDLEDKKNQIIKRKISGKKYPEVMELTETDKKILDSLDGPSGTILFYKEKQEFFIKMEVFGSGVSLIGKCFSFTPLQKAVIKTLFKGVQ